MINKTSANYLPSFVVIGYSIFFLGLATPLWITSCTTLGYENVDTIRKAIIVTNSEIQDANLLLQDLIRTGAINREQGETALAYLQDAKDYLQTASDALNLSNSPMIAESNLQHEISTLSLVINLLAPFAGEPE